MQSGIGISLVGGEQVRHRRLGFALYHRERMLPIQMLSGPYGTFTLVSMRGTWWDFDDIHSFHSADRTSQAYAFRFMFADCGIV